MPCSGDLPGPDIKWRVFNHLSHQGIPHVRARAHTHTHTHVYIYVFLNSFPFRLL